MRSQCCTAEGDAWPPVLDVTVCWPLMQVYAKLVSLPVLLPHSIAAVLFQIYPNLMNNMQLFNIQVVDLTDLAAWQPGAPPSTDVSGAQVAQLQAQMQVSHNTILGTSGLRSSTVHDCEIIHAAADCCINGMILLALCGSLLMYGKQPESRPAYGRRTLMFTAPT
jgi:hypothetical protein